MPLAAGGMARIYIGRTTGIGSFERHVVLKLITPERANDHTAVQMFLDEARLAAALNHQNVAQVFEVGEDSGIHYLAMEYVHGQDLRALLAKAGSQGTRVPLELALTTVTGAAAGLNHAHERRGPDGIPLGIVHRDVSPSNIMIGYDGSVKLLDFGIAKATARSIETQSGIIKGKFAYMAPEQCRGRDVDRRSDVFSLGIILYEITTQHRCFRADSDFDTMHRIVTGDVVRPTRIIQGYPQALEAIVMKALAVDPAQRYQSAGALLEAIESYATAARMSLSTSSLGRFMRDMFGDAQEPWLTQAGRASQPVMPKESTISNTNGTGTRDDLPPRAQVEPEHPQNQARTLLDLPRGEGSDQEPEPSPAEWNAKSYPTMQPAYASTATIPPEGLGAKPGRTSNPQIPVVHQPLPLPAPQRDSQPRLPGLPPVMHTPSGGHPVQTPAGSQPIPVHALPPSGQFPATPGSGSHSGAAAAPIVSTRHGYAQAPGTTRGDVSYPRHDAPPSEVDPNLQLKPNRRPLFIGLGIAAVGFIVLLAMTLGGGDSAGDEDPKVEPTVNMGVGSDEPKPGAPPEPDKTPAKSGTPEPAKSAAKSVEPVKETATPGAGSAAPAIESSIKLVVKSEPTGADVILAGKVIGVTPLEIKLPRGTGMSMITVHKSKFLDATKEIDLSEDYADTVQLAREEAKDPETKTEVKVDKKRRPVEVKRPVETKTPPEVKKPPVQNTTPPPPPKPACQQPSQYDPTDARPVCK